ncbi:MAG: hypothetical protein AB7R89_19015 [Dehalococcoidia bacterium]
MPRHTATELRAEHHAAAGARAQADATIRAARRTLADVDAQLGAIRSRFAQTVEGADEEERAARLLLAVRSDPSYPELAARARDAEADLSAAQQTYRTETARLLRVAVQIAEGT